MKSLHIRDVESATLSRLKRLAKNHHRSLQGELREILEHAAKMAPPEPEEPDIKLVTVSTKGKANWRREEIYGDQDR
jgi:plasmid stability protein